MHWVFMLMHTHTHADTHTEGEGGERREKREIMNNDNFYLVLIVSGKLCKDECVHISLDLTV